MRFTKGLQEDEEDDEEEFGSRREGSSHDKEPKSSDQAANAARSKHSVTEQRRRIKINERFQILRDLIPNSDQKKDTASFLLEVIEYVQYLQERVQRYESSYQGWNAEPTKLMPWRSSHWRAQSFVGSPHTTKNGSDLICTISGKFEENNAINPIMNTDAQNAVGLDYNRGTAFQSMDQQPEILNKTIAMASALQSNLPAAVQSDNLLSDSLQRPVFDEQSISSNALNQQEVLMIEGGTISISSSYSQGLLNTLTEALQNAGVDLSHAGIAVQVDLNKRGNRAPVNSPASSQAMIDFKDGSTEDSDRAQKRFRT